MGLDEKAFSVAAFDQVFLASQHVAVVTKAGRPIAFASIMTTGSGAEATVGLMRHASGVPATTMEFLFVSLILAAKQSGYDALSLGTAPLSGLAASPLASLWHRMARFVCRHGTRVYNFEGLRAFKGKFGPSWEPRYLAVSGSFGPMMPSPTSAPWWGVRSRLVGSGHEGPPDRRHHGRRRPPVRRR